MSTMTNDDRLLYNLMNVQYLSKRNDQDHLKVTRVKPVQQLFQVPTVRYMPSSSMEATMQGLHKCW